MLLAIKCPSEGFMIKTDSDEVGAILQALQTAAPFNMSYEDGDYKFKQEITRRVDIEVISPNDNRLPTNGVNEFAKTIKELESRNSTTWVEKYKLEKENKELLAKIMELTERINSIQAVIDPI